MFVFLIQVFKEETSEHFVPGFMVAVDHEVGQAEESNFEGLKNDLKLQNT